MEPALRVGLAFFPLDEELGLLGGGLTPRGEETLVRLSTWMPYESARELLEDLLGVQVSKATAHRATLATGQAALAVWDAQVERLKQEAQEAPAGAEKQAMSGDGAMVHLIGGEWVEVKTLAIGEVTRNRRGEVCTQHLSYCSRLSDATSFEEATLLQTHRRGLERAAEVCAVQDGAEWLQGLVDYHRADAVRILDFAHAAEYVNEIGQAVQAAGGRLPAHWLEGVLHRLKHQGPERVLTHLRWLAARYPSSTIQEKLAYLQKREAHMQYPTYQQAGWPIGSGSVDACQQGGRRSAPQRGWDALGAPQRQSHAGAAQCGLQSRVEADLDDSKSASRSAAHESATSRQPTAAQARLLDPGVLGSTAGSALPVTCPGCPFPGRSGPRTSARSSSWHGLFLAQTVSETSSFHPSGVARGWCKKMKCTPRVSFL